VSRPYIKEEWKESIMKYKYQCEDHSIFLNYVANPICNWLINFFPKWVAPNIITLTGLFAHVLLTAVTLYYGGINGTNPIPNWVGFLGAACYFSYLLLDILDGKQARRTKSSSPLGMIVDHGSDALVTFLLTLSLATIVGIDKPIFYSLMWFMANCAFFFTTLEEYFTGIMYFPMFSGVAEGCLAACIGMIAVGINGQSIYDVYIELGFVTVKLNELLTILCFIASCTFALLSIHKIYKNHSKSLFEAFYYTFSYFMNGASLIIVQLCYAGRTDMWLVNSKVLIYVYGFSYSLLVAHLQLAHLAKQKFHQFRKTVVASTLILLVTALIEYHLKFVLIDIDYLVAFFLMFNIGAWLHFAYFMSGEMCEFLNIKRFTIPELKDE